MIEIKPEIKTLLENLEFKEAQGKEGLYFKHVEDRDAAGRTGVTAYLDFRKTQRGRRFFCLDGIDGIQDEESEINSIPILKYFKDERDKLFPDQKPKQEAEGVASSSDKFFTKGGTVPAKEENVMLKAQTVAFNRAISDLLGGGEISAEELEA